MRKFSNYASDVNEIAQAAFSAYREAEATLKKAEQRRSEYPQRNGFLDADYAAKSARAHADYCEAKDAFTAAKRALAETESKLAEIRKELAADIDTEYAAAPDKLDMATLEIMKSGILKPAEYSRLMRSAKADNNHTMVRLIAKYASDAAANANDKDAATEFRLVSNEGAADNGANYLQAFDNIADVFHRCTNNPAMIDHWDGLTGQIAESVE